MGGKGAWPGNVSGNSIWGDMTSPLIIDGGAGMTVCRRKTHFTDFRAPMIQIQLETFPKFPKLLDPRVPILYPECTSHRVELGPNRKLESWKGCIRYE